jgi:hypothetical protein
MMLECIVAWHSSAGVSPSLDLLYFSCHCLCLPPIALYIISSCCTIIGLIIFWVLEIHKIGTSSIDSQTIGDIRVCCRVTKLHRGSTYHAS